MRVHKGKDERVRQLCGPGITTLQGRAKKVHVQQQRAPSRVEKKKKKVAPKSKFIWRRKEAPSAVSSQAGREGGCGVEGKQDLKTANLCGAHDSIPPPFPADPHALRTTLLEGGEDDTGMIGVQEEVKPNFRTPPGRSDQPQIVRP